MPGVATRWSGTDAPRGDDYDARWTQLAAQGVDVHGEATLVETLLTTHHVPGPVLDAGCGTGRVAIELARRGVTVVGVDADAAMLVTARSKAPDLPWLEADLAALDPAVLASHAPGGFGLVLLAGNVMIFLTPGTEPTVLDHLASVTAPGGLLVAGFQIARRRVPLEHFDAWCDDAGFDLVDRWSTWDQAPYDGGDYAVSVHRRR